MSWHAWKRDPREMKWIVGHYNSVHLGFVCTKCGFWKEMNYPVPEETLRFLKVPDCETYTVTSIHES